MLFIITEYFHPFSDAGGPVRSIENLIKLVDNNYSLKLITSANSHQGEKLSKNIKSDEFTIEPITKISAYYSKNTFIGFLKITLLFIKFRNHTFYLNGMYVPRLSLLPALICKNVIICPRGMLINETLGPKSFYKKIYLFIYKLAISKKAIWHATSTAEVLDIKRFFGPKTNVQVISNITLKPLTNKKDFIKEKGVLKLVYYGLIVENKSLLTLIKTLKSLNFPVSLDIFGSIKDQSYWKLCLKEINQNNSLATFNYTGHANPADSQTILANYDAFILLTKGENFGHAIYESLSVGTPVVISNKTPWIFEESSTPGGWLINYDNQVIDIEAFKQTLIYLYDIDNDAYALFSEAAHKYALDFYNAHDFKTQYEQFFNLSSNES